MKRMNETYRVFAGEAPRDLVLAIETIIEGGSFSIFDKAKKKELIGWTGNSKISKAEDVLENLSLRLKEAEISVKSIGLVAYAADAGSVTGFKIGSAIAKGFAKSIGRRSVEISLWTAFSLMSKTDRTANKIFYMPFGKERIHRKVLSANGFERDGLFINFEQFINDLKNSPAAGSRAYVYDKLYDSIELTSELTNRNVNVIEKKLAKHIANYASDNERENGIIQVETFK